VHNKRELKVFFYLKVAFFAGFLAIILYTWATQSLGFLITTAISLILAPILAIIYSYSVFNVKCMSINRNPVQQAHNNLARNDGRLADAADLNERQEVAIREFQERH